MALEAGLEFWPRLWSEGLRFARENEARTAGSPFQEAVLGRWQKITSPGKQKG